MGGSAATKPLEFGVGTDTFNGDGEPCDSDNTRNGDSAQLEPTECDSLDPEIDDESTSSDEVAVQIRKRKNISQVPKLVDNKRRHLEKKLCLLHSDINIF